MGKLALYLDQVAGRACGYGRLDCAVLMADWLVACGYPDPMPDRRGSYATAPAYRAAIRSEGGIVASCRLRFARIGLAPTRTAKAGDVALVLAPFARRHDRLLFRPTGALAMSSDTFAVLDWPRGIAAARLQLLAAWSVSRA